MKSKLKKRIKLIKLMMFSFGFLVFIGLFMGINNSNASHTRNAKEEMEEVSAILPLEYKLIDADYKIPYSTGEKIVYIERDNISNKNFETENYSTPINLSASPLQSSNALQSNKSASTQSSNTNSLSNLAQSVQAPDVFNSSRSDLYNSNEYKKRNASQSIAQQQNTAQNNILQNTLRQIQSTNALKNSIKNDKDYIEKGRNSGLFIGPNSINNSPVSDNSILQSVSNRLSDTFSSLQQNQQSPYTQQNSQNSKANFLDKQTQQHTNYKLSDKGSFYDEDEDLIVIAGSIIPIIMLTAINSDLPGMISARVTEDVYDSLYGSEIIIPKGSLVIGAYDSSLSWGQKRLLLAWNRLSRPDGYKLVLEGMQGTDEQGASGIQGKVKTYVGSAIASSVLTSVFSLGVNYSAYYIGQNDETGTLQDATQQAGSGFKNSLQALTQKLLNRQPTIQIPPGTKSYIFVNKDISMPAFQRIQ